LAHKFFMAARNSAWHFVGNHHDSLSSQDS
jgi:hypothetical protein